MTREIRERRDSDLGACAGLLALVHARKRYPIHWPEDPAAWLTPPGLEAAWVAVRGDEVVGHVCLVREDGMTPSLRLERLFVSTAEVGAGVGSALVARVTEGAAMRGRRLGLEVVENCTEAIALYDRLGWRRTGRTPIGWGGDAARWLLHFDAPSG